MVGYDGDGGVRLNLRGAQEVRRAAEEMTAALKAHGSPPVGYRHFKPLGACGAGGILVKVLRDVAVRLTPLTHDDAAEMIRSLKTYRLLTGFRNRPPADVRAFQDARVRLGVLADDLPQVVELDCNPVVVLESGAAVVDARVRVGPAATPPTLGARR